MMLSYTRKVQKRVIHAGVIVSLLLVVSNSYLVATSDTSTRSGLMTKITDLSARMEYTDAIPYGVSLIGADKAWNRTLGSPEIIVAVLDTGLDASHPDLVDSLWNNTDEIPDNGIDDDDNGYVDDYHGWDFIQNSNDQFDFSIYDDSPYKSRLIRHGTHVTGTIAARLNDYGIVGVAPNVSIMTLRIVNSDDENPDVLVAKAIRYATDNGARIISMSIVITEAEITNYRLVEEAIESAYSKGVLIVSAAGNDAKYGVSRPADNSRVIAVGSVDSEKKKASSSNYGPFLEVVAPGVSVYSTVPFDSFSSSSGTSMATPHISGALALMLSLDPAMTNDQARAILQQSTEDLGASGRDDEYGHGLINVSRALDNIKWLNTSTTSTGTTVASTTTTTVSDSFFSVFLLVIVSLRVAYQRRKKE